MTMDEQLTDEPNCAAYEGSNGVELCRLDFAEKQHQQIKATALVADRLERSAQTMARRSGYALADGDKTGATREWCIAAREYDWAAQLWEAIGFRERSAKCRALAAEVRAGDDDAARKAT
jgi:hypothetical protein